MKALILVPAIFYIIVAFSQLGQTTQILVARPQMKMNKSSTLNQTQQHNNKVETCSYLVTIYTSCVSPIHTKDHIDIKFADAYGTEVNYYRLDKVVKFEPCSTEKFEFAEKCISEICRFFLTRKGSDGWIPEKVTIYDYKHQPATFLYNSVIPDDGFAHGYNYCMLA